jgi:FtsP/CotA-like multicopper oxidase with cupredoxin domain
MSNFLIVLPEGLNATLIAADGHYVKPYKNNTLWISVAQRLDILLYINSAGVFPILAVTESVYDGKSKQTGIMLQGMNFPRKFLHIVGINDTDATVFNTTSDLTPGMMSDQTEINLEAFFPLENKPVNTTLKLDLTGDNGFMSINNRSYLLPPMVPVFQPNPYPYLVHYGDRVVIEMVNRNPDSHAMHLHGHTFQVLEINGKQINGANRGTRLCYLLKITRKTLF